MSERNETEQTAYDYGKYVARRENAAHGNVQYFDSLNATCKALWLKLIELGAYKDSEASEFKPEYREHYYAGMDTIPIRRYGRYG